MKLIGGGNMYQSYKLHDHVHHWIDLVINLKTKGNMNIKLSDFSETLIVYILLSTF